MSHSSASDFSQDDPASADEEAVAIKEPRLWSDNGWTARVIKNEDDDGWAVAMFKGREPEPALVGPWTMGRDKKNPKPLDVGAFNTLVKTASEVLRRHEQQLRAQLHKSVMLTLGEDRWEVTLDIVPDEFEPYALLAAHPQQGGHASTDGPVAERRVRPDFKLNPRSAAAWIESDFGPVR
ncbi:hypothetical protein PSQ20_03835 [Curvibacter sp. RS43]|uniref:DUF3305 domain-containing protein n=1 Tax=Curvibacter microcysteis TaxID=3026419 RepID=A0ABT5MEX2_9BURK|nr:MULTISPECIES: hypothetical protein [unclassified Curvibacter]MDD0809453.1 hypothetical protein [Curvibacter sp. RS43]MDD0814549.1 hypothetical protein [Curvibacter sp. HBC28]